MAGCPVLETVTAPLRREMRSSSVGRFGPLRRRRAMPRIRTFSSSTPSSMARSTSRVSFCPPTKRYTPTRRSTSGSDPCARVAPDSEMDARTKAAAPRDLEICRARNAYAA